MAGNDNNSGNGGNPNPTTDSSASLSGIEKVLSDFAKENKEYNKEQTNLLRSIIKRMMANGGSSGAGVSAESIQAEIQAETEVYKGVTEAKEKIDEESNVRKTNKEIQRSKEEEVRQIKEEIARTARENEGKKITKKIEDENAANELKLLLAMQESNDKEFGYAEKKRLAELQHLSKIKDLQDNITSELDETIEGLGMRSGDMATPEEKLQLAELQKTKNALELNLKSFDNLSQKFTSITGIVDGYQSSQAVADRNSLAQLKILSLGVSALTKNPLSLALAGGIKSIFKLSKWLSGERQQTAAEKLEAKIAAREQKRQDEYDLIQKRLMAGMGDQTDSIMKLTKTIEKDIGLRTIKSRVFTTSDVADKFTTPTGDDEDGPQKKTDKGGFWKKFGPLFALIGSLIMAAMKGLIGSLGLIAAGLLAAFAIANPELSAAVASIGLAVASIKSLSTWLAGQGGLTGVIKGLLTRVKNYFSLPKLPTPGPILGGVIDDIGKATQNFRDANKSLTGRIGSSFQTVVDSLNKNKPQAMTTVKDFFKGLSGSFTKFAKAFVDPELKSLITKISSGITKKVDAVKDSLDLWRIIGTKLGQFFEAIVSSAKSAANVKIDKIVNKLRPLMNFSTAVFNFGKSVVVLLYEVVKALTVGFGKGVISVAQSIKLPNFSGLLNNSFIQKIISPFTKIFGFLKGLASKFTPLTLAFSIFDGIWDGMKVLESGGGPLEAITKAGQTMFEDINKYLVGGMLDFFKGIIGWLITGVGKLLGFDMSDFQAFLDSFSFEKLFNDFYDKAVPMLTNFFEWVDNIPETIGGWFTSIGDAITGFFDRPIEEIMGDIVAGLTALVTAYKDSFLFLLDKIKDIVTGIFDTIAEFASNPTKFIADTVKSLMGSPKTPEEEKAQKEEEIKQKKIKIQNQESSTGLKSYFDNMTDEQQSDEGLIKAKEEKLVELIAKEEEERILKSISKAKSTKSLNEIHSEETNQKTIKSSTKVQEALKKKTKDLQTAESVKKAKKETELPTSFGGKTGAASASSVEGSYEGEDAGISGPADRQNGSLGSVEKMFVTAANVYISSNAKMSKAVDAEVQAKIKGESSGQDKTVASISKTTNNVQNPAGETVFLGNPNGVPVDDPYSRFNLTA